jgi:hypothetical protein
MLWWLALSVLREASSGAPGLIIDFTNLQWWQTAIGLLGVLGLSPAPWLLGLAAGKIQFSGPARRDFERQLVDKDAAHQRELDAKDAYYRALLAGKDERYAELQKANDANREAARRHEERADNLTEAVLEVAEIVQQNTHVVESFDQVTREVVSSGRSDPG